MANVFKDAAQSFYSGTFYGELARARRGIGMGLILLLTLLVSALMCAGLLLDTQLREAVRQVPEVAASLPMVTLKDGRLSIDRPVPYRIGIGHNPESPWVVIDTNYKLSDGTAQYMREYNILALVTADKIVLAKYHQKELEIYDLKDGQPFTVTHEQWLKLADTISRWGVSALAAAFFVSFSIAMFMLNMLATLLTAVVIMTLDIIAKARLEFSAAMRLAAAARIPVNVLPVLPVLFGWPSLAGGSGWILWGLYIVFAVCAVRLHSNRLT